MSEIIPILDRPVGDSVNAVDARELHRALEVGRDFSTWFKIRVEELGLCDGLDFEKLNDSGSPISGNGMRARIDYVVSLDAAKHIALAERNEVGRRIRAYFIEAEKRARDPLRVLADPAQLRGLLSSYADRVLALEADNGELRAAVEVAQPKAEALDRIATFAVGSLCVTDAAKVLQVGPRGLFRWLSSNHWIYRRAGGKNWLAYQDRIQQGVLEHKVTTRYVGLEERVFEQVLITPKGLAKIAEALSAEAAE